MARAFVRFSGLASWYCGAGAQLTAPTCSPWLLSKSSGWQSMGRAKTSEGQYSSALLRGQKCLCQAHRQTHCETHTQVCSVGLVWKSMCWLGQRDIRDQEWAIPGEKGEEEVD